MEENLEAVGSVLGNLKSMAVDMGTEIDKQNKHIDSITAKVPAPRSTSTVPPCSGAVRVGV